MIFGRIKDIDINDTATWKDKIFITLDIDWCSDEVLSHCIDIFESHGTAATWFITHETQLLKRLRANDLFELGIHPNFNPLLNGDFKYGKNFKEVIKYYKLIIPEAVSVRSHSLTQSSILIDEFMRAGLEYECNHLIPHSANVKLRPWKYLNVNIFKIPFFWEDDVHMLSNWTWDVNHYFNPESILVFNFHPIHIFLNSENVCRYQNVKDYEKDFMKIKEQVNTKNSGTKDFLLNLINDKQ